MSKRTGDLWWVSPPGIVGPLVIAIAIVGLVLVAFYVVSGRYSEAVLVTTGAVFFVCLAILDVLGEILGGIRDLKGVLGEREKGDTEQPA